MGDIADLMLEGDMCETCGEILEGAGFPQKCPACLADDKQQTVNPQHHATKGKSPKVKCPYCDKMVAEVGLQQHKAAKHMGNQDV